MTFPVRTWLLLMLGQILCAFLVVLLWAQISELSYGEKPAYHRSAAPKSSSESSSQNTPLCSRRGGANWCNLDFVQIAVHNRALRGNRVYTLGYLAIDNGVVTLFASEQDYLNMANGRSLEVRGGLVELKKLFSDFGYSQVRLEGTFDQDADSRRAGRLGLLHPPFKVVPLRPRIAKEGAADISVHIGYLPADDTVGSRKQGSDNN